MHDAVLLHMQITVGCDTFFDYKVRSSCIMMCFYRSMQSMAGWENLSEISTVMKTSALKNDIALIIYISLEK